jgi:hypothetical protein
MHWNATDALLTNILFWVRVPVLSEAITLTQLSVSTVVKFLHRMRLFAIRRAINSKERVTATGRPVGMNPTKTPMEFTIIEETLM